MNHGDQSIFDAANDQHERIMNQSNTPRTDKMFHAYFSNEISSRELCESIAQLETELANANKRADEWKRMAEELAEYTRACLNHVPASAFYGDIENKPFSEVQLIGQTQTTLAKFDQMKGKL